MILELDFMDWVEEYKPIMEDEKNEELKDFWTQEEKDVSLLMDAQRENKVWTAITDDEGDMIIISGMHYVNRLAYYVTEKQVDTDKIVQVY